MQKQSIYSTIILILMLLFNGCGGGESSDSSTKVATTISPTVQTSISSSSEKPFILDAGPISGLKVICGLTELETDANGSTRCEGTPFSIYLGDFKVGDINSIPVDGLIYTQDLLHITRAALAYPEVTKLSMILQSLDEDAEPLNGITLDSKVLDLLGSHLNSSTILADLTFDNVESIIEDIIQTALTQNVNSQLKAVSYDTAQSNLAASISIAPALTYEQRESGGI